MGNFLMCTACSGSGVGVSGDPSTSCTVCSGTGGVINRASNGQFAKAPDLLDRFWSKVDKSGDCWEWTNVKNNKGYGRFCLQGKLLMSHRVSYEIIVGKIPDGLELDHLCRNPGCVNPKHLEAVTHKENMRRARGNKPNHCIRGHELTPDNIYIKYKGKTLYRQCRTCNIKGDKLRRLKRLAKEAK